MELLEIYCEWKKIIDIFIKEWYISLDNDNIEIRESFSDYANLKEIISIEDFLNLQELCN